MALRDILARFGFEVDSSKLTQAKGQVEAFTGILGKLPGIVGGVAGVLGLGAIKDQIDELAATNKELDLAAKKSGVSFQDFQKIQYSTGLGADQLTGLFRKLQQNMAGAGAGAGDAETDFADLGGGLEKALNKKQAVQAFKALGVDISKVGDSTGDTFDAVVEKLAALGPGAQQTALAMRIFGRSGSDLLPFLQKAPEDLKELSDQFDTFGGISDEQSKKLKEYNKQNKAWALAIRSVKIAIVTELVPAFTGLVKGLVTFSKQITDTVDVQGLFRTAIYGVIGAMLVLKAESILAAAQTAASWAKAALPFVILLLVADDLISFFKGDAKTATEDLINTIFGLKGGKKVIEDLRAAMGQWISELTSASSWWDKIKIAVEAVGGVMDRIGSLVGGAITGTDPAKVLSEMRQARAEAQANGSIGAPIAVTKQGEAAITNAVASFGDYVKNFNPLAALTSPAAAPGGKGKEGPVNKTVQSTITVNQTITGGDAQDAADASVEGIKGLVSDQRRADLAALDARK